MQVKFYNTIDDELLKFAVIISRSKGKWVFCKHKERDTYEVPGGHREPGESIEETARRELYEETGATAFSLKPICAYSVIREDEGTLKESFGMLFYAEIAAFEEELHSEIEKIIITNELPDKWTYPLIQPKLMEEAARRGYEGCAEKKAIMCIERCTLNDIEQLAILNKQLIDDEKSNNPMDVKELKERMRGFLTSDYDAYFFKVDNTVVGYALIKNSCTPLYLRQFLVDRKFRCQHLGTEAFRELLKYLKVEKIDIEVLPWNEAGMRFWESLGFKEMSRYMRYEA